MKVFLERDGLTVFKVNSSKNPTFKQVYFLDNLCLQYKIKKPYYFFFQLVIPIGTTGNTCAHDYAMIIENDPVIEIFTQMYC